MATFVKAEPLLSETILRITIENKSADFWFECEDDAIDLLKTLCNAASEISNENDCVFSIIKRKEKP